MNEQKNVTVVRPASLMPEIPFIPNGSGESKTDTDQNQCGHMPGHVCKYLRPDCGSCAELKTHQRFSSFISQL